MSSLDVPGYFTSISGLGRIVDYFPVQHQKLNRWGSLFLALAALIGAGSILASGLVETYDRYYKNGPAVILKTIALPAAGTLLMLIIAAAALLALYRNRNKGAAIFEGGLAYSDLSGIHAWRWDDIAGVQIEIVRRQISQQIGSIRHTYLLTNTKGERLILDESLARIEMLGSIIRDRVMPRLISKYSSAFQAGQPVQFGPITIDKTGGLRVGKRVHPWSQFKEATIQKGILQLTFNDSGVTALPASEIPNLEILLTLLDQKPL